ncbi:hypothetical protein Tco_1265195 [Tanacetum coccineum]
MCGVIVLYELIVGSKGSSEGESGGLLGGGEIRGVRVAFCLSWGIGAVVQFQCFYVLRWLCELGERSFVFCVGVVERVVSRGIGWDNGDKNGGVGLLIDSGHAYNLFEWGLAIVGLLWECCGCGDGVGVLRVEGCGLWEGVKELGGSVSCGGVVGFVVFKWGDRALGRDAVRYGVSGWGALSLWGFVWGDDFPLVCIRLVGFDFGYAVLVSRFPLNLYIVAGVYMDTPGDCSGGVLSCRFFRMGSYELGDGGSGSGVSIRGGSGRSHGEAPVFEREEKGSRQGGVCCLVVVKGWDWRVMRRLRKERSKIRGGFYLKVQSVEIGKDVEWAEYGMRLIVMQSDLCIKLKPGWIDCIAIDKEWRLVVNIRTSEGAEDGAGSIFRLEAHKKLPKTIFRCLVCDINKISLNTSCGNRLIGVLGVPEEDVRALTMVDLWLDWFNLKEKLIGQEYGALEDVVFFV